MGAEENYTIPCVICVMCDDRKKHHNRIMKYMILKELLQHLDVKVLHQRF